MTYCQLDLLLMNVLAKHFTTSNIRVMFAEELRMSLEACGVNVNAEADAVAQNVVEWAYRVGMTVDVALAVADRRPRIPDAVRLGALARGDVLRTVEVAGRELEVGERVPQADGAEVVRIGGRELKVRELYNG